MSGNKEKEVGGKGSPKNEQLKKNATTGQELLVKIARKIK